MRRLALLILALALCFCAAPVSEAEGMIPELSIPQKEIPDNPALRMIRDMKAGWNLGNTFDAHGCTWLNNKLDYETGWCGARTTEALIDALVNAGFRTLRIPVSWHDHLSEDLTIDPAWLDRVYEVASWGLARGMYVIVNIHHDDGPSWYYPDSAHAEQTAAYVRTLWGQIAARFADCDEHLIFESINEPRLTEDKAHEWRWDAANENCRDSMAQIVAMNQVFVDTVRASGGKNAERYLMVPSYDANPYYACEKAFTLPEDPAENRIIVSVHAYTPYEFALQQPGVSAFSLKNGAQTGSITDFMDRLYDRYVSRGIPVLIGEFGAMEKNGNLQDRVDWISWYVANAAARGMTCCWWDNHAFSGDGERFGLFDRNRAECVNPEILEAFMKYSAR